MKERVYIIVLNWNGTEDTVDCLKSLKENNYEDFVVILVDNGSENDNLNALKTWCSDNYDAVTYYSKIEAENGGIEHNEEALEKVDSVNKLVFIENSENLGFAAGNNVALRYAIKKNASYTLLLNNDTVVAVDFLTIMMKLCLYNPTLGAVIPQIRYFDNKELVWNCGGKICFGFRRYYYSNMNFHNIPQIDSLEISFATGCAILFKVNIVGLLTEKFFFGEEDFEFAYRMKKMKKQMLCAQNAIIYHKVGRSIDIRKRKCGIGVVFIYYLNRFINMKDQFNNKLIWNIWRILYSGFIINLLYHKYKHKQILRFLKVLWQKSSTLNKVDRAEFELAMDKELF